MTKNILIWVAHPKAKNIGSGTLCESLADVYQEVSGRVRVPILGVLIWVICHSRQNLLVMRTPQALEPDLIEWQKAITWADHIVIIHPYWWGAMPTKVKAVLDRALTPGFAYKYHSKGMGWNKLLKGKTADVIITADTPRFIDTLVYKKTGRRVLKNQVLGFCGIKAKKIVHFGSVKLATPKKINHWLVQVKKIALRAAV